MEVIIGNNCRIHESVIYTEGAIRGCEEHKGSIVIGDNVWIGANVVINIGKEGVTRIGDDCIIMNQVNIGHNTIIGNGCEIGAGTIIAGHSELGENCKIKIGCIIRNRVWIRGGTAVGTGSVVSKNLDGDLWYGNPIKKIDI